MSTSAIIVRLRVRLLASNPRALLWMLVVALGVAPSPSGARAEDVIFTIDPTQSSAMWSGTDDEFGTWQEQSAGSLSSPISGHFLVTFDPFSGTPSSLQFVGGHGYYQLASPHTGLPGIGGAGPAAAANLTAKTAGDEVHWAIRDLVWDFSSGPLAGAGVFAVSQTQFTVLSGSLDFDDSVDGAGSIPYTGESDDMTGGTWTISESAPGSGSWTLEFDGYYDYVHTIAGTVGGSFTASGVVVSTAQFGSANVEAIDDTQTQAQALGGASTTGGVTANFSQTTSGGTFSVQQIPNPSGLSQAAVTAAEANPIFAISTDTLSANPQIWSVDFSGDLNGGTVDLIFHYDSSLLPAGLDEQTLGVWHYNKNTDTWDFGGVVDDVADTITYTTDNFSPFQLGVFVPEPSTLVLAGAALLGIVCLAWRKRRMPRR